jgi:hypothetical protein
MVARTAPLSPEFLDDWSVNHHTLTFDRPPNQIVLMTGLRRLLRDLSREIDRLAQRNEFLERRLESITGALQGTVRGGAARRRPVRGGRRGARRGAPPKFDDVQAMQLRKEYEKGATSAQLARRHKAALPTILSTLRRAGATLRRGRPSKNR